MVSVEKFRQVMSHFCTGVVVITACDGSIPVGFTCQSFSSLSIDPPLILFCPSNTSTTWPRIRAIGNFCVNVLNEDQEALSGAFARSGGPKFEGVNWMSGTLGAPRLRDAIAHIDCRLRAHAGTDCALSV
jgi:flavin reductase (DIM6/NTAB) family NADH-FMN oxidoreductase RutF